MAFWPQGQVNSPNDGQILIQRPKITLDTYYHASNIFFLNCWYFADIAINEFFFVWRVGQTAKP